VDGAGLLSGAVVAPAVVGMSVAAGAGMVPSLGCVNSRDAIRVKKT